MPIEYCIPIPSIFTTPYDSQSKEKLVVEKMAPLCRFELECSEFLTVDQEAARIVDKVGWGEFFDSFNGHNIKVTRNFSVCFK